ncbi:TetR/AcrR family transcriptional regulator [Lysinibacillus sp. Bpr_S20]|uniref:TetR/AcrR family transcriptional regulator n=1 Tax=Lysinibacillus sp. Bpr_S20 TaxID=2933964 RepID=UPI00201350C3|nr:TetR/AcrR family transcriptional regulator [Lysinibacillus sp. Bpr_S20]MCL1702310.1 TetR/AcrR family transcriptional regulator [Lysinibacillus sp. Bpr_S20]
MEKSKNPISIRSRKIIINTLLELMKVKEYSEITITEIVIKAQLARKTFYRNFKSKDDVLNEYVDYLFNEYIHKLANLDNLTNVSVTQCYFEFWQEHVSFLKLLERNSLLIYILKKYDEYLPFIQHLFPCKQQNKVNDTMLKYSIAYSSGGFWKILCKWIEDDCTESPEEMGLIYNSFMEIPND